VALRAECKNVAAAAASHLASPAYT